MTGPISSRPCASAVSSWPLYQESINACKWLPTPRRRCSCGPCAQVGDKDEVQCLEKAEVVREGTDISIFTYSRMRYVVMQAVAELEKKGYNPEVRV